MRRLVIWVGLLGCGDVPTYVEYCDAETLCEHDPYSDYSYETCVDRWVQTEGRARADGCDEAFEAWYACGARRVRCEQEQYVLGPEDCIDEIRAYEACREAAE